MQLLEVFRIICALLIVLGMIGTCALLAKRFGVSGQVRLNNKRKRLQVVETISLDNKRRLAIIRCDAREHLIVLNPAGETVIETNIELGGAEIADPVCEKTVLETKNQISENRLAREGQNSVQPEPQNPFSTWT